MSANPQARSAQGVDAGSAPSPKWWGESLTIWGTLLTAVSTVAPALFAAAGIDISADLIQRLGQNVIAVVQALTGLTGTVLTIIGRVRASKPLERRPITLRM